MKDDVCRGIVMGEQLEITGNDFLQAAKTLIEEENANTFNPNMAIIDFACNAVRLWREYEAMATKRLKTS